MNERRWLDLCPLDALPDTSARGFDPFDEGRDALFVVRRGGELNAYRNRCPHQGSSLPWERHAYLSADRTRIVCSAHGAQFEIGSGLCTSGPALGHSLERVPVHVAADGTVRARLAEKNRFMDDSVDELPELTATDLSTAGDPRE